MTTIRDVAKSAGVSPITVSRVVNRQDNVTPETRVRVEKAIHELGYVRNLAARSLRSLETHTIALILPDITNLFWTTVARGVEDAAQSDGYSVLLCNTDENPDKFSQYLNTVLQQRVDGVLITPITNASTHFARLAKMNVPAVVVDRRVPEWEGDAVYCDSIAASQALTQHLLSLGHQRIAIISGPSTTSTAEDRVTGYCLALRKAGLPVNRQLIYRGEFRASSGRSMTRELVESGLAPTAIIATNNAIAAGVLEELKNLGKNVPGDIALVCFDEIPEMERFFPFLTTVVQPAYDMGVNATQLLLSRISAINPIRPRQVILPTRLILRYSCGQFLKTNSPESKANIIQLPDRSTYQLVKPLDDNDRDLLLTWPPEVEQPIRTENLDQKGYKANKERLIKALAFEKTDRLACIADHQVAARLGEHLLGKPARYMPDGINLAPEIAVEYAQKLGLDAIPCDLSWSMRPLAVAAAEDMVNLVRRAFPPPALANQLGLLENLITAADGSGVGIYARFSSFFDQALAVISGSDFGPSARADWYQSSQFEKLMDLIARHQERVIRAICDRFSQQLCFISIQDNFLSHPEMVNNATFFDQNILARLARMLSPIHEHGLPVGLATSTLIPAALPGLHQLGFRLIQSSGMHLDEVGALAQPWLNRLVFSTGLPESMERAASPSETSHQLRTIISRQSGVIFNLQIPETNHPEVSPQYYINQLRAVQRFSQSN